MVIEGLKLTLIGMSVVFLFLLIMIFTIKLSAKIFASATRRECEAIGIEVNEHDTSFHLMAVISAAIKKHRQK